MTAYSTEISVCARFSELPGLLSSIADQAAGLGIPAEDSLRLQLVVEELFTNTIAHGHRGDSEHPVFLTLGRDKNTSHLRYADDAPPFDLFVFGQKTALTVKVGGLGINLIRGLCTRCEHRRIDGRNVTEIEL
ncbi:MAG: ATP-binding protein [Proteobacteria bacterium]|nr:ATP-binding protein [Pseudomonadota bacterium]